MKRFLKWLWKLALHFVKQVRSPILGLLLSFAVTGLILLLLGESPKVLEEAFRMTLRTSFGMGYALFYTTPLIFTGLAVALAFQCGLLNIGGEGQLYVGAMAVVIVGTFFNVPPVVAIPLGILAAGLFGAAWASIAGTLKATRGSHEVIVTILLNFIGVSLVDYAILYPLRNPEVQNPETLPVLPAFELAKLSEVFGIYPTTPVNLTLLLAIAACLGVHFFLFHTTMGFEMRAVGTNPTAARFAGISVRRNIILAMFLSGALAGFVGVNQVMGHAHKITEGFSPGYGFTGIAVALLARNRPLGVLVSAFLFGVLHNCSRELEFLSDKVSKEVALVLQGTMIAFIACDYLMEKLWRRMGVP